MSCSTVRLSVFTLIVSLECVQVSLWTGYFGAPFAKLKYDMAPGPLAFQAGIVPHAFYSVLLQEDDQA